MNNKVKRITMIGMFAAIAFAIVVIARIPVVLFLKYDPKDIVITLGGFIMGPVSALLISVIVSVIEMITISDTGIIGCIMNILSTCSFACVATVIYYRKKSIYSAVIGLFAGCIAMVVVMLLWNYLLTPIYMKYPREAVVELLLPVFLPFNLLKGGLNAAFTFLLYKPIVTALRKSGLIAGGSSATSAQTKAGKHIGLKILAFVIIAACVLMALSLKGII